MAKYISVGVAVNNELVILYIERSTSKDKREIGNKINILKKTLKSSCALLNILPSELKRIHISIAIVVSMAMKCSECDCVMNRCKNVDFKHCVRGNKKTCCRIAIHRLRKKIQILIFFNYTRTLFAAALGIEILCISAAEIGENSAFYFFGYHLQGIILGYIIGY